VVVVIGKAEVKCKLPILQRTTKFFKRGVGGMVFALPTANVTLESFMVLYGWMDKPCYVIPPKLLMTTFRSAGYLKVYTLLEQFYELFSNPDAAREEIGFYMVCGLQVMNSPVPFPKVLRIKRYFLTMIGTPEYLTLWPHVLINLLDSTTICVNSEMEVLFAILMWLFYDYDSRSIHAIDMMSCVRFDCIPSEAIVELREHSSFRMFAELFDRPEFEMFVRNAPPLGRNTRLCNRRNWVYDELCNYHHDAHCLRRNFINIKQFRDFQLVLRSAPEMHWWDRNQLNPYVRTCRNKECRDSPKRAAHK
ncbi:hypothetical protein KR044_007194, partial [Drosophila immigrans]